MTGRVLTEKLPEFIQLDFEAFYSLNPQEFIGKVMPMMSSKISASNQLKYWAYVEKDVEVVTDLTGIVDSNSNSKKFIKVSSLFNTTASILFMLSNLEIYGPPILPGDI